MKYKKCPHCNKQMIESIKVVGWFCQPCNLVWYKKQNKLEIFDEGHALIKQRLKEMKK